MSVGPYSCTGGGTAGAIQTTDPAAAIAAQTSGTWDGGNKTYYTSGIFNTHALTIQNATIFNTGWQGVATAVTSNTLTFANLPAGMVNALPLGPYYCQDSKQTQMPVPATVTSISGNTVTLSGASGLTAGSVYRFAGQIRSNTPNFNATLENDSVTGGTIQNLTLDGFYPNDHLFYPKLAPCEGLNFKSCSTMTVTNILSRNNFSDGFTFNYVTGYSGCTGFTCDNLAAVNCGRESYTPQAIVSSTFTHIYSENPTHNDMDFESDSIGVGAGGLTFDHYTSVGNGGLNFIEAILGTIAFTNVTGTGRISYNNLHPSSPHITFATGTWVFPSNSGSNPCISQVGGWLGFSGITMSRVTGTTVDLPAWGVTSGAITNRELSTIRQGYSYHIQSGTPQVGMTPSSGTGFDGTSASTIHVQGINKFPDPTAGPISLNIADYLGTTVLGAITYGSIPSSGVNPSTYTIGDVVWVSGSATTTAGTGISNSCQLQYNGATVGGYLSITSCTFAPSMLSVAGSNDAGSTVYLTGNTNLGGGVLPTHCNGFSGLSLASGQVPVCSVPGFGDVQLPTGSPTGVAVLLHGLVAGVTPSPALSLYRILAEGLSSVADGLVLDGWACLWPSYPHEGQGNTDNYLSITNDLNSGTSGSGAQLLTTYLLWWDHVVAYCGQRWPGKQIVPIGWSEGGYMALQAVAGRPGTMAGALAHEPATIWANAAGLGFTFPAAPAHDLTTSALAGVTIPVLVSYGTNDGTVGYNTAGTGGTPVSNTDTMITNGGSGVVRRSTTDTHQFTAADAGAFLNFVGLNFDSSPHYIGRGSLTGTATLTGTGVLYTAGSGSLAGSASLTGTGTISGGSTPITVVNSAETGSVASTALTFPAASVTGNGLVCFICQTGSTAAPTMTGWTQYGTTGTFSGTAGVVWCFYKVSAGEGSIVPTYNGGATGQGICYWELAGMDSGMALDTSPAANSNLSAATASLTVSTGTAGSIVLMAVGLASQSGTVSAWTGTDVATNIATASTRTIGGSYITTGTLSSQVFTASWASSRNCAMLGITIKS